jgi:hypothetical protein
LKSDSDNIANLLVAMMELLIINGKCSEQWKEGKQIMIHKTNDENNAVNWRPITLKSSLYRLILESILQAMMAFEDSMKKKTVSTYSTERFCR